MPEVEDMRQMNFDFATVIGLASGFGLLLIAVILGGAPMAFFDLSSLLIVLGGTFAVTMVCFSLGDVLRAQTVMFKTIFNRLPDVADSAYRMVELAELARRDGVLGLEARLRQIDREPFLHKALSLVIDGTASEELDRIMRHELMAMRDRHAKSADVFRKAAEVAPAMGLIGTLVGLVRMLGSLDDPSTIGPSVALLTTFYGAILSNMVFGPIASKLERNSSEESLLQNFYLIGAGSISRQENPRRLEVLLNTLPPPTKRLHLYD